MNNSLRVILLGGIASLASFAGATAADLPQAEPVEYVKVCETYGAGFWYVPGTDTCLKVGGYVRFQMYAHSDNVGRDTWEGDPFEISGGETANDTYAFYTRGLVNFDARTETEYGTLRSFIQIRGTARDTDNASVELDKAFLQFAGVTAGLAPSFFTIDQPVDYLSTHNADFGEDTILLGYTAELGSGFTASVAVESGERANDGVSADAYLNPDRDGKFGDTQTEVPAGVANLTLKQSWGSASIAGAVGESKSNIAVTEDDGKVVVSTAEDSDVGWAVAGGLTINLPTLGEGDAVHGKVAYSDGLSFYTLGTGDYNPGNFSWYGSGDPDDLFSDSVKVFTAYAGYVHNWTSSWRSNFAASYADIDFGTGGDDNAWGVTATANVIWTPVKNLDIGLELIYSHVDAEADAASLIGTADGSLEDDGFGAIFRIQRNFGS